MSDSSGSTLTYTVAILAAVYVLNSVFHSATYKLRHIPTAGGPSFPILSFISVFNVLRRGPAIVQEANRKFKGRVFKYASMKGWIVAVTDPRLIEELGRAPDDILSMDDATNTTLQIYYTLGKPVFYNDWHNNVVRTLLTRNLETLYPDMYDEVVAAVSDLIAPTGDEWTAMSILTTNALIVSRVTNRVFVGLSLCRVPEYCDIMQKFTFDVIKSAAIINLAPAALRPIVGRYVSTLDATLEQCSKYTGPVILERLQMREKYGDNWSGKPMDALQNLVEIAPAAEYNVRELTRRLLAMNFASIHTSSTNLTTAMLYLASNPAEYLYPLRDEVDSVVAEYGWTRSALQKMRKVDSFLKESLRVVGLGAVVSSRLLKKDHTFSDGTHVPAGTVISVAAQSIHRNESIYGADASEFKPWRFSDMRDEDGEGSRRQVVSTNVDFVPFGYGRHACPGRFFATTELKTILAHIVTTYDVKLVDDLEGVVPPRRSFAMSFVPNSKARVMFRKRQPKGTRL